MDVKDVPAMRRFLEQYRREYPEDNEMLQDGYAVIADCFEHPGAQARAAAERWVQTHNGSTLKQVREPPLPRVLAIERVRLSPIRNCRPLHRFRAGAKVVA